MLTVATDSIWIILQDHWLFTIRCDLDAKTDQAICACGWHGRVQSDTRTAVGDWIHHLRELAG